MAFREAADDLSQVVLESAHHHVIQIAFDHLDAAAKALGIEQFEQGGETVRMAVVRGGGQEQTVLEPGREALDGARDLRVDGVALAAGGRGVMRFVEDEQGAGAECSEPVAQGSGVGLVDQETMGNQKAGMSGPGVDAEASLAPNAGDEIFVENLEWQAEALLEFFLPLEQHRRRASDYDFADLLAHQQLSRNQASLDGLSQADVIGDEEIHAWQAQGFPQRFELIGVEPDAGAKGRLQEAGVGGSDAIPAEGIEVGGEVLGRVEAALGKPCPFLAGQDSGVEFALPEHAELLPLRVVFDAGEFDERGVLRPWTWDHALYQVKPLADADDLADFWEG